MNLISDLIFFLSTAHDVFINHIFQMCQNRSHSGKGVESSGNCLKTVWFQEPIEKKYIATFFPPEVDYIYSFHMCLCLCCLVVVVFVKRLLTLFSKVSNVLVLKLHVSHSLGN